MAVLVRINTEVAIWISRTKTFLQLPQGQMFLGLKTFSSQSWIQLLLWFLLQFSFGWFWMAEISNPRLYLHSNPEVDILRQNQQQRTHFSIWESMQIEKLQKGRGLKGSKIFSRLIFIASIVRKLYTLKMEKEKRISCFLILMLVVLQQLHKSFKNYHSLCS